jgi:hypothetical protein
MKKKPFMLDLRLKQTFKLDLEEDLKKYFIYYFREPSNRLINFMAKYSIQQHMTSAFLDLLLL